MESCELYTSCDGGEFELADKGVKKKFDNIQRLIAGAEADKIKIEGTLSEREQPEILIAGKPLSLKLNRKWSGAEAGTGNKYAVKNKDGSMLLPKGEPGGGHDIFGLKSDLKAGPIKTYVCVKISDEELEKAEDDLVLFYFEPRIPGGRFSNKVITVADYRAARENTDGYKVFSDEFILAADGIVEGKILNERKLDMTISEFGIYEFPG